MNEFPSIEKGLYRHNKKGQVYKVLGVALQTETNEPLVIYCPFSKGGDYEFFARPYAIFKENVEVNGEVLPRFEKIKDNS